MATPHSSRGRPGTTNLDSDRLALIRSAVRLIERTTGRRYSAAEFLREAVDAQLAVVAHDYNDGRPIAPDYEPLPKGRRST